MASSSRIFFDMSLVSYSFWHQHSNTGIEIRIGSVQITTSNRTWETHVIWRRECREKFISVCSVRSAVSILSFIFTVCHIVLSHTLKCCEILNTHSNTRSNTGTVMIQSDLRSFSWIRCCGSETVGVIHVAAVHAACMAVCFVLAALPMYILLAQRADSEDRTKDWAPPLIPYVVCSSFQVRTHSSQITTHRSHHSWFRPVWIVTVLLYFKR